MIHSSVARGQGRGKSVPLKAKTLLKIRKKRENFGEKGENWEKRGKEGKNWEEKAKTGEVLSICSSWQRGLATPLVIHMKNYLFLDHCQCRWYEYGSRPKTKEKYRCPGTASVVCRCGLWMMQVDIWPWSNTIGFAWLQLQIQHHWVCMTSIANQVLHFQAILQLASMTHVWLNSIKECGRYGQMVKLLQSTTTTDTSVKAIPVCLSC